ncbi:ARF guanine-nucleotide exchange factor GNL2-like [Nymphaea colorata]|nr:ARF guanine-nucleotide exchange factor GNL2-like [Nymphaea colorata]XP_031483014.1 ARF guanine-nucleotide exchange factor GNL2-like [Nymphaea colorata]XP_031483025.1 ARF guanine-nucleotide exchange factor GNL2-like [Nymphaea colorata]XP_031483033.1 ARF guanine-nucleotide exchange factor GNL2-like [Nymphaea colorata]
MIGDGGEQRMAEKNSMDNNKRVKRGKEIDLSISCMVNTEVGALLAVMRMSPGDQCASQFIPGADEALDTSLMSGLKSLRTFIFSIQQDWHSVDPSVYLSPFLEVIQFDEIAAPAVASALSATIKILKLDIFDSTTPHSREAMHLIVDAITNCRLERSGHAADDTILMRILQLLISCLRCKASVLLSDSAVCTIVNTCFQVVQQSASRGHLLQRSARLAMHELVQMIYAHLPEVQRGSRNLADSDNFSSLNYGIGCMVDIFQFICSLLNVAAEVPDFNAMPSSPDEDVESFALVLINSAIEIAGEAIGEHPKLLKMIQEDLFYNLIRHGSHSTPLVLSLICSVVLNLYNNLRSLLKLQLEAFFRFVCLKIARGKLHSIQQEEVAIEGLVSFCRQPMFGIEMYTNFDCNPLYSNVFEEIGKLLCKRAFPNNGPLSSIQAQSFEGLVVMIQHIADGMEKSRSSKANSNLLSSNDASSFNSNLIRITEYKPFWTEKCERCDDPKAWVEFMRVRKYMKKRLLVSVNHFNLDEKKGLEFLKHAHLVPDPPEAQSLAYFLRFTPGLDKTMIGDYLGDPDEFHLKVLKEFTSTFDFKNMILDAALRNFLETFRLPGESQKIQRILEAFAERFYEQSDEMFVDKDAVFVLCYSLIMLNTDQHNAQVKKKMTEEEFIKNNRNINGGKDLPREYLSELFQSISTNEITLFDQSGGSVEMTPSRWINIINQSKTTDAYIFCEGQTQLNHDMFSIIAGPAMATLATVFEHADDDQIINQSMEGFLAVARIARYNLEDVLDEILAMLCKFTTLLNPFASLEETFFSLTEDVKPRLATLAVFTIANKFGDSIRSSWRNVVDCLLRLKRLKLLPPGLAGSDNETPPPRMDLDLPLHSRTESGVIFPSTVNDDRRFSSLIGKFGQFISTENDEESISTTVGNTNKRNLQFINQCCIEGIFSKSKHLHEESLQNLGKAILLAGAGRGQKFTSPLDEEETAAFCWDLIVMLTENNIDRFMSFWPAFHDCLGLISQLPLFGSCPFVEKSLFGVLNVTSKLLHKADKTSEELIFKSLQLIWKIDSRVVDSCCEALTQISANILKENAKNIQTQFGWKSIIAILSISARSPEAFNDGVEALISLMSDNVACVTRLNYSICIESAFSFSASKLSSIEKSMQVLDLMADSVNLLVSWLSSGFSDPGSNNSSSTAQDSSRNSISSIGTMFVRLVESIRKICLVRREEIRNHAVLTLKRCFTKAEGLGFTSTVCLHCFNHVIFAMADDLLEKAIEYSRRENSEKEMRSMEGTLCLAMEFLTEAFIQFLRTLSSVSGFRSFWMGVLRRMDTCMKTELGDSDKMQILIPTLLKKMILAMKEHNILVNSEDNELWDITVTQILWIAPAVKDELFPGY